MQELVGVSSSEFEERERPLRRRARLSRLPVCDAPSHEADCVELRLFHCYQPSLSLSRLTELRTSRRLRQIAVPISVFHVSRLSLSVFIHCRALLISTHPTLPSPSLTQKFWFKPAKHRESQMEGPLSQHRDRPHV